MRYLSDQRGIALVISLLMMVVIMLMAASVLYFIGQSTKMSGAGKVYATASEAADGAIQVTKDGINLVMWGESVTALPFQNNGNCDTYSGGPADIGVAIMNNNNPCTAHLVLPALGGLFMADVSLERLYSVNLPGSRLEFARSTGGLSSTAIFFRITTKVTGPNNATAENATLYRFAG